MLKKVFLVILIVGAVLILPIYADAPSIWAGESVDKLKTSDIFDSDFYEGYKTNMTRKEFAYLSVKLFEDLTGKITEVGEDPFKDTDDEWVLKGYNEGLISGYNADTYGPSDLITREQLAVLLMRVIKASGVEYDKDISGLNFVDDNEISSWAKESVYLANKNGILNGIGSNTVSPRTSATKEQAMIMSLRIVDNSVNVSNVDNSVNNDLNISDNEDSTITINIDNTDNSVTDSYNTYNDYSTVVNNYVDNSVKVNNMSADSLKEIIDALMQINVGLENFSFHVYDKINNKPIVGAIIYINNEVGGVSDKNGLILVDISDIESEKNIVIRKTGYKQYYDTLELVKDDELDVFMEKAADHVAGITTDLNKEIYEAYAPANEKNIEITVYGDFLEYKDNPDYQDFQLIDEVSGNNLIDSWEREGYGSNHINFSRFKITLNNDGLLTNGNYLIKITKNLNIIETNLVATDKQIITRIGTSKISIIKDHAFISYQLNRNRHDILDAPLVLTNQDGDVIYQEVTKFQVEYSNLIYFELVNKEALENARYLYVGIPIEGSVLLAMKEFHRMETVYEPVILIQDYGATSHTNNNYVDKTVIAFYGYNLMDRDYLGKLENDETGVVVSEASGFASYADNGFLEKLEFEFDRDELETGEYKLDIVDIMTYGRYQIDK